MRFSNLLSTSLIAIIAIASISCTQNQTPQTADSQVADTLAVENETASGFKMAFIYGDTINFKYRFLIDAQEELESEGKLIEERIRRKLQRAEQRAGELQQRAQFMTQTEMQEAQNEMQGLEIDLQQFEQKLGTEFRERELALQREYVGRIDSFLAEYNADGTYDVIMNFQAGGNLLWANQSFDITNDVLEGLNEAYDAELSASASEAAKSAE